MPVKYSEIDYKAAKTSDGFVKRDLASMNAVMGYSNECVQVMSDVWEYQDQVFMIVPNYETETFSFQKGYVPEGHVKAIDAPPAAYEAWMASLTAGYFKEQMLKAERHYRQQYVGQTVRVERGRRSVGAVGLVVYAKAAYYGAYGYRRGTPTQSLCVALTDRHEMVPGRFGKSYKKFLDTTWVYALNVELVTDPFEAHRAESEVSYMASAREYAKSQLQMWATSTARFGGLKINYQQQETTRAAA